MRILFVTPRLPYPPFKGDQLRTYHFIRELAKEHTIDLLSFTDSKDDDTSLEELNKHCRNIKLIHLPKWWSLLKMLIGLFSLVPFQILYYSSMRMHMALKKMLSDANYDVVHISLVRMMEYALECGDTPVVVDHIDALSLNMKRRMSQTRNPLLKAAIWWEGVKMERYERKCELAQTHSVITSKVDAAALGYHWMDVVSNGVNTDQFAPQNVEKKFDTIFTGNMSYFPNVDAIHFYHEEVLPHLLQHDQNHQFYIVGINPTKDVKALKDDKNVFVTGFVDDLTGYLNRARLFVAPLQAGTGIQNKILEAMSCGLPVVSTSYGNAGIGAKDGQEIIIANDGSKFAAAIRDLLANPEKGKAIGRKARELVQKRFGWASKAEKLADVYHEAIHLNRIKMIEERAGRVPIEALRYKESNFLTNNVYYRRRESLRARVFDLTIAGLILLLSSPLWLGASLAILLTSGRPILFRQQRVGQGGKLFHLYKLRTMVKDAEINGAVFAAKNDSRVTPLGKFLRKTRIDELPQLFNILRGDMKVIGPRPERPEFVRNFNHDLPMYVCRHYVKPGLTGWAQVMFQYAAGVDDTYKKLQYDLYYIKNKTVLLDLFILLRTVGVVLTGKGAR